MSLSLSFLFSAYFLLPQNGNSISKWYPIRVFNDNNVKKNVLNVFWELLFISGQVIFKLYFFLSFSLSFITFVFVFVVNIMDFCFDERDHYKHFCINIMAISFLISQYDQKLFSSIGEKDVFDVWNLKHDISFSNLQVYLSFSGIGTKIPYHDR